MFSGRDEPGVSELVDKRNAIQAIEGVGRITIRTAMENGNVTVRITDNGREIPSAEIDGLFDPTFSKEGTRVKAGLGLFTSYNIMHKHRGEIRVESRVGEESTFTIVLPLDLEMPTE